MNSPTTPLNWRTHRFGELFRVKHGYAFKGKYFSDSGPFIVLTPGNFIETGGFRLKSKEKYYVGEFPREYILEHNDLIVAMTEQAEGLLGSTALVPKGGLFLHNQRLGLITGMKDSEIDKRFLYYLFNTRLVRAQIQATASGVKVRHTSPSRIYEVEIALPPLPTQRKIAAILSAYDDLIENNTRRIAILEEMARLVYREWFVHFRFPGHEGVRMVESEVGPVPEGWEVLRLDDTLATLEAGGRPKGGIDPAERGVPSIGAENVIGLGRYDFAKVRYVSRHFFDRMTKGHIHSGDVVLYKDGAQIGRKSLFRDGFPHDECCVNEHVFILRTNGRCSQSYLYFWLDLPNMTQEIVNLNTNAAQPGINQEKVRTLPVLLPSKSVLGVFEVVVEPLMANLFNLAKKNIILRRTRDLLLPRLVSGEVDVSELDIAMDDAGG